MNIKKISLTAKDNYLIRLIELSKINITIKNKISDFDNDNLIFERIFYNNSNLIMEKIILLIEEIKENRIKYNNLKFNEIKILKLNEIKKYFFDKILRQNYIGCSIYASSYLKEKPKFETVQAPYIQKTSNKKYNLILDLDETLVHFKVNNKNIKEGILKLRPGLFKFLEKISKFYEIILFTEASEAYTKLILETFNNNTNKVNYFSYKFFRQHSIIIDKDFVKDLSRIGIQIDKTIIIDNTPQNFKLNKENGILIKPFFGEDNNDRALIELIPILINIAKDDIDVKNGLIKYRDEIITKISSNLYIRNRK